jgi:hypothetical protein
MVEDADPRVIKLVRQVDEERQRRIRLEHEMRDVRGQLVLAKKKLAAERVKTTDAKPKSA